MTIYTDVQNNKQTYLALRLPRIQSSTAYLPHVLSKV
jgi:hypothetical protein